MYSDPRRKLVETDVRAIKKIAEKASKSSSSSLRPVKVQSLSLGFPNTDNCQCSFITLSDTPNSYDGQAGKVPVVNETETGLIFSTMSVGVTTFLELSDTPDSFSGQAGKVLAVNTGGTAIEFIEMSSGDSFWSEYDGGVGGPHYIYPSIEAIRLESTEFIISVGPDGDATGLTSNCFAGFKCKPAGSSKYMVNFIGGDDGEDVYSSYATGHDRVEVGQYIDVVRTEYDNVSKIIQGTNTAYKEYVGRFFVSHQLADSEVDHTRPYVLTQEVIYVGGVVDTVTDKIHDISFQSSTQFGGCEIIPVVGTLTNGQYIYQSNPTIAVTGSLISTCNFSTYKATQYYRLSFTPVINSSGFPPKPTSVTTTNICVPKVIRKEGDGFNKNENCRVVCRAKIRVDYPTRLDNLILSINDTTNPSLSSTYSDHVSVLSQLTANTWTDVTLRTEGTDATLYGECMVFSVLIYGSTNVNYAGAVNIDIALMVSDMWVD